MIKLKKTDLPIYKLFHMDFVPIILLSDLFKTTLIKQVYGIILVHYINIHKIKREEL